MNVLPLWDRRRTYNDALGKSKSGVSHLIFAHCVIRTQTAVTACLSVSCQHQVRDNQDSLLHGCVCSTSVSPVEQLFTLANIIKFIFSDTEGGKILRNSLKNREEWRVQDWARTCKIFEFRSPVINESVEEFKYLGTTLTNKNSIQKEIKSRLKLGDACYHSV